MMNINPIAQPVPETSQPDSVRPVSPSAPVMRISAVGDTQAKAADPQAVKEAVSAANGAMKAIKSELDFSIDDTTGKTIVRVVDGETGEVIRQMPAKEVIEIAKALDRLQGLLVRQKA
jgi:flagellar protein FlaG